MATVESVLGIARSQIGVHENPANSDKTPYTEWYGMTGPWCAMFVSWVFYRAGLPLPATTSLGFAYTPSGATWFQQRGKWTRTPRPGYVVFFDWPDDGVDRVSHVGIVEAVRGDGAITTIEGNTGTVYGGSVLRRMRRNNIVGYGIPDYERTTDDWFDQATPTELEQVVRRILQDGTAYGKKDWGGTSRATLGSIQDVVNLIRQQVIPNIPT